MQTALNRSVHLCNRDIRPSNPVGFTGRWARWVRFPCASATFVFSGLRSSPCWTLHQLHFQAVAVTVGNRCLANIAPFVKYQYGSRNTTFDDLTSTHRTPGPVASCHPPVAIINNLPFSPPMIERFVSPPAHTATEIGATLARHHVTMSAEGGCQAPGLCNQIRRKAS